MPAHRPQGRKVVDSSLAASNQQILTAYTPLLELHHHTFKEQLEAKKEKFHTVT